MRRITEIPETVTRQCSRDEKDLMEHSAVKNLATLKKNTPDSTSSAKPKEETLKNRVFSLKSPTALTIMLEIKQKNQMA